jgi:hypothetical protein
MDIRRDAIWASASEGGSAMADQTLRRCIGSARFGIEPHDAPVDDFPKQPSQKDGLGRMCKTHWNRYTAGLARDAKARKAEAGEAASVPAADAAEATDAEASEAAPKRARRPPTSKAVAEGQEVAG